MLELLQMFLSKSWEFFQIQWPGFSFSIGDVFLASTVSVGAFVAIMKMAGVSAPSFGFMKPGTQKGGNNSNIKISEKRKGDTK